MRGPPGGELVAERIDRRRSTARRRRVPRPRRPRRTTPARRGTRSPGWMASAPVAQRRFDDPVDRGGSFGGGRRTDPDRVVGQADVEAVGVGIAVDRDRLDPSSWQARMIRTAISPRFAMRTRPNGRAPCSVFAQRRARATASQRDVAMLLRRVRVALVGEDLEGRDQAGPRLRRIDHVVDVAARRGDIRVRELAPRSRRQAARVPRRGRRRRRSRR